MSVLQPISKLGQQRSESRTWHVVTLIACLLLGGVGGFFLGHFTALEGLPPTPGVAPAATAPETKPAEATGDSSENVSPAAAPGASSEAAPSATPVASPATPASASPVRAAASRVRRLELTISGSLAATLASKVDSREADLLTAQLGRILVWWVNLRRDVLPGDRLVVLYEPAPGPGELRLLAAHFTGNKANQVFRTYLFERPGMRYARYYDEGGTEIEQRLENAPLKEYEQVTELLNQSGRRRHRGVDFKVDSGTEVIAPFRAQVLRRNWHPRGNGNCLELLYLDKGIKATLLHLEKVLPEAKPGAILQAGTVVALSGNTGFSTAPHLHYQLEDSIGRILNPLKVHKTYQQKLEGDELKAFIAHRDKLDRQLGDANSQRGDL